jgi:hypothetical protein
MLSNLSIKIALYILNSVSKKSILLDNDNIKLELNKLDTKINKINKKLKKKIKKNKQNTQNTQNTIIIKRDTQNINTSNTSNTSNNDDIVIKLRDITKFTSIEKIYAKELLNIWKIITIDSLPSIHGETKVVGTFKYDMFKYPGDIDVNDVSVVIGNKKFAISYYSNAFKEMAMKIKLSDNIYFSDFKLGYDNRYFIDIGDIKNKKIKETKKTKETNILNKKATYNTTEKVIFIENAVIIGYNKAKILKILKNLFDKKLFSNQEYSDILTYIHDNPTPKQFVDFSNKLREYYTLRWDIDEMVNGFKHIKGRKITMEEALNQKEKSIVKIDVYGKIDNRLIECTSFFILQYYPINSPEEFENESKYKSQNALNNPLWLSKKFEKPYLVTLYDYIICYKCQTDYLKYAKRLWLFAIETNNYIIIKRLYKLFNGNKPIVSQIISDCDVIIDVLQKIDIIPNKFIVKEILNFNRRFKISPIGDIELSCDKNSIDDCDKLHQKMYNLTRLVYEYYQNDLFTSNPSINVRNTVINILKIIQKQLYKKINNDYKEYLEINNLMDFTINVK